MDKKKFLNVNIINLKKVDNPRSGWCGGRLDNVEKVFFVEVRHFFDDFWLFYYIFSSIKLLSSYNNEKKS